MYLKKAFVGAVALSLPALLFVSACKKKREFKEETGQEAEDVRSVQGENDEAGKDVNVALMEQSLLRGRLAAGQQIELTTELCGVIIDTAQMYSGMTHLSYTGATCNGLTKTGNIYISIQGYPLSKWKNKGCVLKVDFVAYKVVRNGRSVQFDGTEYFTNESGGTWYDMRYLNASNLVQTQTGDNIKITYDDNNTAVFSFNRRLTFNYTNSVTTCQVEGLGTSNGISNLDNWGQNRDGNNFTSQITSTLMWKSNCGCSMPVSGGLTVKVDGKDFDLQCTYGVDQNGSATSACPYGWKVSWSYKRNTSHQVFAY